MTSVPVPRGLAGVFARAFVPLAFAAGAAVAFFTPSCNTAAVGIEACRSIEAQRCSDLTACGKAADWVTECTEYYRDQCLAGIQNESTPTAPPTDAQITACKAALNAVAACAQNNTPLTACPNATLVATATSLALPGSLTPCNLLAGAVATAVAGGLPMGPELLFQCAFVVAPAVADAGAGADADAATVDASDAADAADAAD